MSLRVKNMRKSLRIDIVTHLTVNVPTTLSSQNKLPTLRLSPSPDNREANLNKTPDSIASLNSNFLTIPQSSYALPQISQSRMSFNELSSPCLPSSPSLSSLPRIVVSESSRTEPEKNINYLEKIGLMPKTKKTFLPVIIPTVHGQIEDECTARFDATRKSITELSTSNLGTEVNSNTYKEVEKALENADSVLGTMGIKVKPYFYPVMDSSMTIFPVTDKKRLAKFYKMFIPEMCRFNYVFISNLRIGTITVCESVRLTSKKYDIILDQKIHNGLFILEDLFDKKTIQNHWFKIILNYFLKAVPEFYDEWKELVSSTSGRKIKLPFKELVTTFSRLVGVEENDWKEDPEIRKRVNMLKEALKKFNLTSSEVTKTENEFLIV